MPNKIHLLSELTINQIAAGEVIENPASVVKELIENAIDAGATQIDIEILSGGFQKIRVSDNGSGMSAEDAVLSLERHATSKLSSAEDLFSLATMGFRGEALASIAAISKMSLTTALEDTPALHLEIEGGKIQEASPAARLRGTTIEVRSLFYNVPARKKFQKSPTASSAELTRIVSQLALAHPEIGITLTQQGRLLFSLPAASKESFAELLQRRVITLLGDPFFSSSRILMFQENEWSGSGLLSDPQFSRHNRSGQHLFVNRRPVSCLPISYAIRDAYGTRLSSDAHPFYVLHLFLPSSLVDINVHPQKKEIRLREESMLKYTLHHVVNRVLSGEEVTECLKSDTPPSFFLKEEEVPTFQPLVLEEERDVFLEEPLPLSLEIEPIGIHGRYLLITAISCPILCKKEKGGVVWIDLVAAEARIQFDTLLLQAETTSLAQGLLLPLSLSFSRAEAECLSSHIDLVHMLGLQIRRVGEMGFLIEAIPPCLEEKEIKSVLEAIIGTLQGLERENITEQETLRCLATEICRQVSVRTKNYSLSEGLHIVKCLINSSDPLHSPLGKPILFHIEEDELESYFK